MIAEFGRESSEAEVLRYLAANRAISRYTVPKWPLDVLWRRGAVDFDRHGLTTLAPRARPGKNTLGSWANLLDSMEGRLFAADCVLVAGPLLEVAFGSQVRQAYDATAHAARRVALTGLPSKRAPEIPSTRNTGWVFDRVAFECRGLCPNSLLVPGDFVGAAGVASASSAVAWFSSRDATTSDLHERVLEKLVAYLWLYLAPLCVLGEARHHSRAEGLFPLEGDAAHVAVATYERLLRLGPDRDRTEAEEEERGRLLSKTLASEFTEVGYDPEEGFVYRGDLDG